MDGQTRDNDILLPIQNQRTPILTPNRQITTMQHATRKKLPRRLLILQIPLCTDITREYNLADFLAVFLDIDEGFRGREVGLDDADGEGGDEAVALACHEGVFFGEGNGVPVGHVVAFGYGAVGFG